MQSAEAAYTKCLLTENAFNAKAKKRKIEHLQCKDQDCQAAVNSKLCESKGRKAMGLKRS
jgi:hypothetical protein